MLIDRIVQELLCDLPSLISAHCRLSCKIKERSSSDTKLEEPRINASIELVTGHRAKDAERLKSLLDKAKIIVASSTLAASIFFAGAGQIITLHDSQLLAGSWLNYVLAFALAATSVFLLLAGFLALLALGIQKTFDLDIEDEVSIENPKLLVAKQLQCLDLNRLANLRVANLVHASHKSVRNGLFSMVILILAITLSTLIATSVSTVPQPYPTSSNTILSGD